MKRAARWLLVFALSLALGSCGSGDERGIDTSGDAGNEDMGAPTDRSAADVVSDASGRSDVGSASDTSETRDGAGLDVSRDASPLDAVADALDTTPFDASGDVAPGSLAVGGRVIDVAGGPMAGVTVDIDGRTTSTDASGHFTMSNVRSPYQLAVVDLTDNQAVVYQGVARSDPTVQLEGNKSPGRSAPLMLVLRGNFVFTQPPGGKSAFDMFSSTLSYWGGVVPTPMGSPYSYTHSWAGPTQGRLRLFGLQYAQVDGVALSFSGFALDEELIADNSMTTFVLDFAPVPTTTLTGTVTAPSGYVPRHRTISFYDATDPGTRERIPFTQDGAAVAPSFSYVVPATPLGLALRIEASRDAGIELSTAIVPNATSPVAVTLLPAALLTTPHDQAINVDASTVFSWTAVPGAVHQLWLRPMSGLDIKIYTAATTLTLPALTALGASLAARSSYQWQVMSFAPRDIDAILVPHPPLDMAVPFATTSTTRSFATK